jgi:hypothetical protein
MALSYPDNLKHQNSNYPLISSSDLTVQGFFHVADLAARDAIPILKRITGSLCIVGSVPYTYTNVSLADADWELIANWSAGGGGGSLVPILNRAARLIQTQSIMGKMIKRGYT